MFLAPVASKTLNLFFNFEAASTELLIRYLEDIKAGINSFERIEPYENHWVKNLHAMIICLSPEGGPRMSVASARTADSTRTTKFRAADADLARTRLLKILKHKYLMFFYVLRMRVSPQNAVIQVTLSLQIGFFKFKKVFSE